MPEPDEEQPDSIWDRLAWYLIFTVIGIFATAMGILAYNDTGNLLRAAFAFTLTGLGLGMLFGGLVLFANLLDWLTKGYLEQAKERAEKKRLAFEALDPEAKKAKLRKQKRVYAAIFALVAVFYAWFLPPLSSEGNGGLILRIGGSLLFGFMAIMTWASAERGWTDQQEESAVVRALGWMVLGPVILVAIGAALFFGISWLSSIPSWAAVIIVLLVMILLNTSRR